MGSPFLSPQQSLNLAARIIQQVFPVHEQRILNRLMKPWVQAVCENQPLGVVLAGSGGWWGPRRQAGLTGTALVPGRRRILRLLWCEDCHVLCLAGFLHTAMVYSG